MTKKVCAVTVSQNYLERKKYSIKYLFVAYRQTGESFWFVRHVGETGLDKIVLTKKAIHYSFKNNIPFMVDIRHGQSLNENQIRSLKKYGVAV